jgi:predicted RNA-binding protein with PUA domain
MPRTAAAFTLRYRADKSQWSVRFRLDGARIEVKIPGVTLKSQRAEASRLAADIYAAHVKGA